MIWRPNSESKCWVCMDKNFQGLQIQSKAKSIGKITQVTLKNQKFKVKIYSNRQTSIGPTMILLSFQVQWMHLHQLMNSKKITIKKSRIIWGQVKLLKLATGKILTSLVILNTLMDSSPPLAGLNKKKISNVMELIDLKEQWPRF